MGGSTDKATDQRLLEATLAYVASHADRRFDAFREAVADWGEGWTGVAPVHLPASDLLADALPLAGPGTAERELMGLYVKERASRHWEQSYTSADSAVGTDMLSSYGYAEIVGEQGPFVSTRIRAGIAAYGPHLDYPLHRHQAEEIYAVLAGGALCSLGDDEPALRKPGDVLYHAPNVAHGLRTTGEPLVIAYLWQNGDLREKPGFV